LTTGYVWIIRSRRHFLGFMALEGSGISAGREWKGREGKGWGGLLLLYHICLLLHCDGALTPGSDAGWPLDVHCTNKTQMERLKREQGGNDEIMTIFLLHPGP